MTAPRAIIAGAARIRAGRRVGALAARHVADLLGLTPRPVLDRPAADPTDHLRGSETANITIIERL